MTVIQVMAAVSACLFAGSALYASLVESRAMLARSDDDAIAHFVGQFGRAGAFQAPLALVSAVAGTISAVTSGDGLWIAGAVAMVLVVAVTGLFIFPINAKLLNVRDADVSASRSLLVRWYRLHGVRGVLALMSGGLFVTALALAA